MSSGEFQPKPYFTASRQAWNERLESLLQPEMIYMVGPFPAPGSGNFRVSRRLSGGHRICFGGCFK